MCSHKLPDCIRDSLENVIEKCRSSEKYNNATFEVLINYLEVQKCLLPDDRKYLERYSLSETSAWEMLIEEACYHAFIAGIEYGKTTE